MVAAKAESLRNDGLQQFSMPDGQPIRVGGIYGDYLSHLPTTSGQTTTLNRLAHEVWIETGRNPDIQAARRFAFNLWQNLNMGILSTTQYVIRNEAPAFETIEGREVPVDPQIWLAPRESILRAAKGTNETTAALMENGYTEEPSERKTPHPMLTGRQRNLALAYHRAGRSVEELMEHEDFTVGMRLEERDTIMQNTSVADVIVASYFPLLRSMANRESRGPFEQRMQAAKSGLLFAIDTFDPEKKDAFPAYAMRSISRALNILRAGALQTANFEHAKDKAVTGKKEKVVYAADDQSRFIAALQQEMIAGYGQISPTTGELETPEEFVARTFTDEWIAEKRFSQLLNDRFGGAIGKFRVAIKNALFPSPSQPQQVHTDGSNFTFAQLAQRAGGVGIARVREAAARAGVERGMLKDRTGSHTSVTEIPVYVTDEQYRKIMDDLKK